MKAACGLRQEESKGGPEVRPKTILAGWIEPRCTVESVKGSVVRLKQDGNSSCWHRLYYYGTRRDATQRYDLAIYSPQQSAVVVPTARGTKKVRIAQRTSHGAVR